MILAIMGTGGLELGRAPVTMSYSAAQFGSTVLQSTHEVEVRFHNEGNLDAVRLLLDNGEVLVESPMESGLLGMYVCPNSALVFRQGQISFTVALPVFTAAMLCSATGSFAEHNFERFTATHPDATPKELWDAAFMAGVHIANTLNEGANNG